jgi:hypothetical protein
VLGSQESLYSIPGRIPALSIQKISLKELLLVEEVFCKNTAFSGRDTLHG